MNMLNIDLVVQERLKERDEKGLPLETTIGKEGNDE